jgi:hypothetical protein
MSLKICVPFCFHSKDCAERDWLEIVTRTDKDSKGSENFMINPLSLFRSRTVLQFVCAAAFLSALTLLASSAVAQGPVRKAGYGFTYPQAIACAGVLRAQPVPARTGAVTRAVWTFAMAAGEMGRRQGLAAVQVEKAIQLAEGRARKVHGATRNARARDCIVMAGRGGSAGARVRA